MSALGKINDHIATLKKQRAALDEALVPARNGVVDHGVGDAMEKIDGKLRKLDALRVRAMALEDLGDGEISLALGERAKPSASPTPHLLSLSLPQNFNSKEEIATVKIRRQKRLEEADPLTVVERQRLNEIVKRQVAVAIDEIEERLLDYTGAAGAHANEVVAYTQGQHLAVTQLLASLHVRLESALEFNRDERLTLKKRIDELECRPTLKYSGVWEIGRKYEPGEFVTEDGSLWHCEAATQAKPGSSPAWKLSVKRGRDGRDAR